MPPILLLLWSKITVDLVKKLDLVKILAPPKNFTKSGLHCNFLIFLKRMFLLFLTSKGSGFKLGPVTGEFLATLVVGKCPKYAVEPFAASRFPETSLQSFL